MTPTRIQLRRTKGWRKPEGAIVVSRLGKPNRNRWANPFVIGDHAKDRAHAVQLYREWLLHSPVLRAAVVRELRGRDLTCWCPLDQPCHADVLLDVANT
jgi:Domain of unknown function (DUF4326)